MYLDCIEIAIEDHEEHCIPFLLDVDGPDALSPLGPWEKAPPFDLKPPNGPIYVFCRIEARIPRWSELDSEEARCFVLRNFSGNPEGFSR
jgi:hypothetical protein